MSLSDTFLYFEHPQSGHVPAFGGTDWSGGFHIRPH